MTESLLLLTPRKTMKVTGIQRSFLRSLKVANAVAERGDE